MQIHLQPLHYWERGLAPIWAHSTKTHFFSQTHFNHTFFQTQNFFLPHILQKITIIKPIPPKMGSNTPLVSFS